MNFRTSLRRQNVIYTRATFSRTKVSAKWSVTAATLSSVTSCMEIRAQCRLFQVKVMFKQHVNLMIWTWILRLQTASRNEFPCKNSHSPQFPKTPGGPLCPWATQINPCLFSTGSTQEDSSGHEWENVDWDVKNQIKQKSFNDSSI